MKRKWEVKLSFSKSIDCDNEEPCEICEDIIDCFWIGCDKENVVEYLDIEEFTVINENGKKFKILLDD